MVQMPRMFLNNTHIVVYLRLQIFRAVPKVIIIFTEIDLKPFIRINSVP